MKIDSVLEIPFPRELVYETYRDRLPELVPYLPNIRGIECRSRTREGDALRLVNHWRGGGEVPSVARPFVPAAALEWTDYALWNDRDMTTTWRNESGAFREAVHSEGLNRYEAPRTDHTRLFITGVLEIDVRKVPGVPRLLAATVGPAIEGFIVARVKANLTEVSRGVERFLREQR